LEQKGKKIKWENIDLCIFYCVHWFLNKQNEGLRLIHYFLDFFIKLRESTLIVVSNKSSQTDSTNLN
jgi:hypothetical protein